MSWSIWWSGEPVIFKIPIHGIHRNTLSALNLDNGQYYLPWPLKLNFTDNDINVKVVWYFPLECSWGTLLGPLWGARMSFPLMLVSVLIFMLCWCSSNVCSDIHQRNATGQLQLKMHCSQSLQQPQQRADQSDLFGPKEAALVSFNQVGALWLPTLGPFSPPPTCLPAGTLSTSWFLKCIAIDNIFNINVIVNCLQL